MEINISTPLKEQSQQRETQTRRSRTLKGFNRSFERLRKNEESLKAAISGAGQLVKKPVTAVTQSVEFHFHTEERMKKHPEQQLGDQHKEMDFAAAFRKHPASPLSERWSTSRIPKLTAGLVCTLNGFPGTKTICHLFFSGDNLFVKLLKFDP